MGIGINMGMSGLKQNYSYLFQSLPGSSGNANLNFLSDYISIKNGSYGKLMKAYYAKDDASDEVKSVAKEKKSSISTAKDDTKTLASIQSAADGLKESADKLISKGTDSVFKKVDVETKDDFGFYTTSKDYDKDEIYKSVSSFVDEYNSLLKEAGKSDTNSVINRTKSLTGITKANEKLLAEVGITIGEDNKLSIDEKAFKEADMNTAKSLFNGNSSYAYRVSAQASLIDFAASTESSKANTYNVTGNFNQSYSSGSIFDYGF